MIITKNINFKSAFLHMTSTLLLILLLLVAYNNQVLSQQKSAGQIKEMIDRYKNDARGPYKAIRWFCPDGTNLPADQRCKDKGGVQRAQYKDEVISLANSNNVYLGQILATTLNEKFWDEQNEFSRLKQYQIEKYIRAIDNGWVLRKAQFYRGAMQAEDEENWGVEFYKWLLADDTKIKKEFFLIRESMKDIPHRGDDNKAQKIRTVSKIISDAVPSFMDIRIKIHGQPEASDIQLVKEYRAKNYNKLPPAIQKSIDELTADMEAFFKPTELKSLNQYLSGIPDKNELKIRINSFIKKFESVNPKDYSNSFFINISELLYDIRINLLNNSTPKTRLHLLDVSLLLEEIYFKEISRWKINDLNSALNKSYYLSQAIAATGFIELWEWDNIKSSLQLPIKNALTLEELMQKSESYQRIVEWSSAMINTKYENAVKLFSAFEPLTYGFIDNKVRSSLLLALGQVSGSLKDYTSKSSNISNYILGIPNQNSARGLNPGYAMGELIVITGSSDDVEFEQDKIYAFDKPPADLKPVAGIMTVSEGNLVSHVQLLARNLGIPNSVLSADNLNSLLKFNGKKVFYAVSPKSAIVIKLAENMSANERKLFEKSKRSDEVITVPTNNLLLDITKVVDMSNVRAKDSGKLCGPKAANLGELKYMFPSNVVNGLVIPFGIFREHMAQEIPNKKISYWDFLLNTFKEAERLQNNKTTQSDIDKFVLSKLDELRTFIKEIKLLPSFVKDLQNQFKSVLGAPLGSVAVFIRSDTNMEDLKDFTGAGLNLTVFNVLESDKILQGIKDVWASPYTERSYKWRQKFLNNPKDVYPSILIIPTVDVETSGVMITKGLQSGDVKDVTIAFSKGAGGAVEGQKSETYLLKHDGQNILTSPSRELHYNQLPSTGGTFKGLTSLEKPLLSTANLNELRLLSKQIIARLPNMPGVESKGPFDIELGIKDSKIWLFQVRPFVENKRAASSDYLQSLDPIIQLDKTIKLSESL